MKADLLHVVEAAYRLDGTDHQWLRAVTNAIGPLLDEGHGVYGVPIDPSDPAHLYLGKMACYRGTPAIVRAILRSNRMASPADVEQAYRSPPAICTIIEQIGVDRWRTAAQPHGPAHIQDCTGVFAVDPTGVGCMVVAPHSQVHRYPARVRRVWARVVAHLASMQRLRQALAPAPARSRSEGEAVLSPRGAVEHAEGPARLGSARTQLREAALARERARGRLRRQDPEEAVDLWRALVAGRWSIVDRFDRDGRRFLIAHENEPAGVGPRALTARERQVVQYVAMGHPNKLVAYQLGLSVGSISAYLSGAMRKLGVASRLDLVRLVLAARAPP